MDAIYLMKERGGEEDEEGGGRGKIEIFVDIAEMPLRPKQIAP